jgi:hypothetical protein
VGISVPQYMPAWTGKSTRQICSFALSGVLGKCCLFLAILRALIINLKMSDSIKNATTEEIRIRNYMTQLKQHEEIEVQDLEGKHQLELERLGDGSTHQIEELRKAYDVQISREAEGLEERLHQVRLSNEERVGAEKREGDAEVAKAHTQTQQRIAEYKKIGDAQLDALKKQFQASTETIHDRARKQARKEMTEV